MPDDRDPRSAGERQLARWAAYPTRSMLARGLLYALAGTALHMLFGYLFFDRDAAISDVASGALWFGALLFAFIAGTSAWARHQARRGRRAWWLNAPDE